MEFEAPESYKGIKANLTFREIVMNHLRKITQLCCVEFRGGFYIEKIHTAGGGSYKETIYIPDTRETYINAVNMLHDLLLPIFDKQMKSKSKILEMKYQNKSIENTTSQSKGKKAKEKLEIKRELFQELSHLLKRLRYLEGKEYGEVI